MGDLLSFAYPEALKMSFPEMFKDMIMVPYTVEVTLWRKEKKKAVINSVNGKIAAFINDEHRHSVPFRAGSPLFPRTTEETASHPVVPNADGKLGLERSVVLVPSGWQLRIEVDLCIKIEDRSNEKKPFLQDKPLKATLIFGKETLSQSKNKTLRQRQNPKVSGINVEVTISRKDCKQQDFPAQLTRPVEVFRTMPGHPTIVYTVGDDVMPYTEFIRALRRIVSDHPDREDILGDHDLLNICSTPEHPVLSKMRSVQRGARWFRVKLQVVEDEEVLSTTLVMRCEDLYIHGFFNQRDVLFKLCDDSENASVSLIPRGYHNDTRDLNWDVSYPNLLEVDEGSNEQNGNKQARHQKTKEKADKIVAKLRAKKLDSTLAKDSVKILSSYTGGDNNGNDYPYKEALVYLLIMVCESARMNPIRNSVVEGWSKGMEFTNQMLEDYIWKYSEMSEDLRKWKRQSYTKQEDWKIHQDTASQVITKAKENKKIKEKTHPICQLQAIYLVHSGPDTDKEKSTDKGGKSNNNKEGESSNSSDKNQKDDNTRGGDGQHGETSGGGVDPSPLSKGPKQQSNEAADEALDHGRHLVELLAVHADLGVIGTKIIVFDAKRGQIIYRKKKKGKEDQGKLVKLELTGPYRGISAYESFAIEIDIPADAAGSSSGDDHTLASTKLASGSSQHVAAAAAGDSILWEWNCYDPGFAAEVDGSPVVRRPISSGPGRNVEVTYAVMSNAREATVQVKLRLKDGPSRGAICGGKITALIDGFQDEHKSVLLDYSESTSTVGDSWFRLQLSRDVVAVPCRRGLKINVTMQIKTCNDQMVDYSHAFDFFNNGICWRKNYEDEHGSEVQVNITWYPEVKTATEVVYTIGDEVSYIEFILALRHNLSDHPDREDVLDEHPKLSSLSSTGEHPVLAKQRAEQPARWIHVKLQAQKGDETLSTTLLMRDDNLYVCGFINQQGVVYELIENPDRSADILPVPVDEYNPRPQRLCWGVGYRSLLDARRLVKASKLNRDFAMNAVYVLSRFPSWVDDRDVDARNNNNTSQKKMNPRFALAGLIIMFCESARMIPVNNVIARQWNTPTYGSYYNSLDDEVFKYGRNSGNLLAWKSKGYPNPCPISQLQDICLVLNFNYRVDHPPQGSSEDHGRPRVELLAIRADLRVHGMTVMVFDGKRGQIIYTEKQEEKGTMPDDLVLTGPYTSISAYGCFAIKIDIPPPVAAPGSSKGDAIGSMKWEWDCYNPVYANQVDKGPKTHEISSGPGRKVEVIYAVMSNALEATVQVKMRSKDWNSTCSVHGLITARIGDFNDNINIILFRRTPETAHCFSPTHSNVTQLARSLKLARNVLAVPCDRQKIEIRMLLNVETSKNKRVTVDRTLSFDDIDSFSQLCHQVDGFEFEVNVAWPDSSNRRLMEGYITELRMQVDISYTVGDDAEGFSSFITELRRLAADHPRCRDLMANHPELSSTSNHPVLLRNTDEGLGFYQRERVIHIKLEAGEGVHNTSSITLLVFEDNFDVIGFINNDGDSYQFVNGDTGSGHVPYLPLESMTLDWGPPNYTRNLYYSRRRERAEIKLGSTKLGKTLAAEAVRKFSRFKHPGQGGIPDNRDPELMGALVVMVCDSARIEPVRDAIASKWDNGAELTEQLDKYRRNWSVISGALLDWRDHAYQEQGWPQNTTLESMGIKSSEDARKVVHLVFNDENRISDYYSDYY